MNLRAAHWNPEKPRFNNWLKKIYWRASLSKAFATYMLLISMSSSLSSVSSFYKQQSGSANPARAPARNTASDVEISISDFNKNTSRLVKVNEDYFLIHYEREGMIKVRVQDIEFASLSNRFIDLGGSNRVTTVTCKTGQTSDELRVTEKTLGEGQQIVPAPRGLGVLQEDPSSGWVIQLLNSGRFYRLGIPSDASVKLFAFSSTTNRLTFEANYPDGIAALVICDFSSQGKLTIAQHLINGSNRPELEDGSWWLKLDDNEILLGESLSCAYLFVHNSNPTTLHFQSGNGQTINFNFVPGFKNEEKHVPIWLNSSQVENRASVSVELVVLVMSTCSSVSNFSSRPTGGNQNQNLPGSQNNSNHSTSSGGALSNSPSPYQHTNSGSKVKGAANILKINPSLELHTLKVSITCLSQQMGRLEEFLRRDKAFESLNEFLQELKNLGIKILEINEEGEEVELKIEFEDGQMWAINLGKTDQGLLVTGWGSISN